MALPDTEALKDMAAAVLSYLPVGQHFVLAVGTFGAGNYKLVGDLTEPEQYRFMDEIVHAGKTTRTFDAFKQDQP